MAAKKKKSSKPQSEQPPTNKPEIAPLAVQPPVVVPIVAETHAPILAKPRKKKNKFSNVEAEAEPLPTSAPVDEPVTIIAVQQPVEVPSAPETHAPILAKPRKKKNKFNLDEPEPELKLLSDIVDEPVVDVPAQAAVDVPVVTEPHTPARSKPRKKKKNKSDNVASGMGLNTSSGTVDEAETAHFVTQTPHDVAVATEPHTPIRPKPRRNRKKNKSNSVALETDSNAFSDSVHTVETDSLAVQPPRDVTIVTDGHAPVLAKPRKKKKSKFSNSEPEDVVQLLIDAVDHSGCSHGTEGSDETPFVEADPGSPEEASPTQSENDRQWGFQVTSNDEAEKSPLEVSDAPVNLSFLNRAGKDGAGSKAEGEGGGKQFGYINIARQEALEAVSDFKTRILERAAKKALNDTPFIPSPYPYDLYLYENPDNTPEDNAMLSLKRRYDSAIMELDSSLAPVRDEIPLDIAKRVAIYVSGLVQSHDGQFRCALQGLRDPAGKGQPPLAPWIADTWEERLLDSDRDWLLGKKIDDMTNEKARRHACDCADFILKYKLWGHMVEAECAEMGVQIFPRLN